MTRHQFQSEVGRMTQRRRSAGEEVVVTWRVDAAALAKAVRGGIKLEDAGRNGRDAARSAKQPAGESSSTDADLRLTVRRRRGEDGEVELEARATAQLPGRARAIDVASAHGEAIRWSGEMSEDAAAWLHIDISADGWACSLSLRPGREAQLAYARTDLFQRLRIGGGRYEPKRAEITRCAARPDHLEVSA